MAVLVYMMFGWFGTVIRESEGGSFNKQVDGSFRWGMSWFIFSEVMFFAAFFRRTVLHASAVVPWLGSGDTMQLLWPDFSVQNWPISGPASKRLSRDGRLGIPAINTLILLTSGVTVTWAHWGLRRTTAAIDLGPGSPPLRSACCS